MDPDLEARLDELELKLDLVLEALGVATGGQSAHEGQARQLIRAGRKIEAIKVWREATGDGLAESKRAVERLEGR